MAIGKFKYTGDAWEPAEEIEVLAVYIKGRSANGKKMFERVRFVTNRPTLLAYVNSPGYENETANQMCMIEESDFPPRDMVKGDRNALNNRLMLDHSQYRGSLEELCHVAQDDGEWPEKVKHSNYNYYRVDDPKEQEKLLKLLEKNYESVTDVEVVGDGDPMDSAPIDRSIRVKLPLKEWLIRYYRDIDTDSALDLAEFNFPYSLGPLLAETGLFSDVKVINFTTLTCASTLSDDEIRAAIKECVDDEFERIAKEFVAPQPTHRLAFVTAKGEHKEVNTTATTLNDALAEQSLTMTEATVFAFEKI